MAQINFPVATADGQTFEAPNGVIYTYVGTPPNGYWSGTFQDQSLQTLDGRYLKLDASNDPVTGACDFTGLTTHEAGVDVVNAVINSDGSATFAGGNIELTTNDIIIKNVSGGTPDTNYTAMSRLGSVDMYRSGASPQNDSIFRLRTNPAGTELTPIEFKGDGSASFAGNVTTSVSGLTGPGFLEMKKEGNIRQRYDGSQDNTYAHALYSLGTNKDELNYILRSTGNIEIGGNLDASRGLSNPNISLRATDGSASFAGTVRAGDNTPDQDNKRKYSAITEEGIAAFYRDSNVSGTKYYGAVKINTASGSNPVPYTFQESTSTAYSILQVNEDSTSNWRIANNGSATFEGCVRGKASVNTDAAFRGYYSDGEIGVALARQMSSPSGQMQTLLYDTSGSANITLTHQDGSATFAGGIECLNVFANRPSAGNFAYGTGLDGSRTSAWLADSTLKLGTNSVGSGEKISLNADGSGTFAGDVQVGGDPAGGANAGCDVRANGSLVIAGNSEGDSAITIYDAGNSSGKISLNADGSVEFAGGSCTVASSGRINIDRAEGQQYCFTTGYDGNTEQAHISGNGAIYSSYGLAVGGPGTTQGAGNAVINADGSAEFAGGVSFSGATGGIDTSNFGTRIGLRSGGVSSPGLFKTSRDVGSGGDVAVFSGNTGEISLKGDGSARFAGDVASEAQISAQTFLAESAYSSTLTGDSLFSAKGDYTANAGGFYPFRFLPTEINKDTPASSQLIAGYSSALNILKTANSADKLHAFSATGLTNDLTSGPNIKEVIGYYSNVGETAPDAVGNPGNYQAYNFFAEGSASNYFAGDIDCDGLINGAFSLRMESDDPAAFQTTYSTDEEGNQVENQTYIGTSESLLDIIRELRAANTALEARIAALEG